MDVEFNKRFLTNTDETGRFVVRSIVTGRAYYVEPIDNSPFHHIWGDFDPATKKFGGNYGEKYKGAVTEDESMIKEGCGFDKIHELKVGESPTAYIERIDKEWEDKINKNK